MYLVGVRRSVHVVAGSSSVNFFESSSGAFVEDTLGLKAPVLIISVGDHAGSEGLQVNWAELCKDVLAWGALVFSGKTNPRKKLA